MNGSCPRAVVVSLVLGVAATALAVVPTTAAPAAEAADSHVITGRVYAPTADEALWLTLYSVDGEDSLNRVAKTVHEAGDLFAFSVPDGTYQLYAASDRYDGYDDSEAEWYPDAPTAALAEEIVVDGADVVVQSVVLEPHKTISGRVVGPSGSGMRGLRVRAYAVDDSVNVYRSTRTDDEGRFVLSSGRGRWKVLIEDPNLAVAPVWVGGAASHGQATVYDVSDDLTVPTTTVTSGASISGTVTSSLGGPIRSLTVFVHDDDGAILQETTTRADGYYLVPALAPGSYRLRFGWQDWADFPFIGEFYDDKTSLANATPITVIAEESVTGRDAVLTARGTTPPPTSPGISGRVVDAHGTPLAGKPVRVTDRDDVTRHGQAWFSAVYTDANGHFHFSNLPADRPVRFFVDDFTPSGVADDVHGVGLVYVPGVRDYDDAQAFDAPDTRVTLPDLVVEETGAIRGTVLTEEGLAFDDWPDGPDPYHRPHILVFDEEGTEVASTLVGSDGSYRVRDLPAGEYRVDFVDDPHELSYVDAWWGGASMTDADPITVAAGQTTSGIDAVVRTKERLVEGRLQDPMGRPLTGIVVHAVRSPDQESLDNQVAGRSQADGTFRLHLPPGSYKLHFGDHHDYRDAVVDEYYDDQPDFGTATPVLVPSGQPPISLGDVTLTLDPAMSGRVVDELGRPLVRAVVEILGTDGRHVSDAGTDVDGRWRTRGLEPGTYRVRFSYGYATEFYDDRPTFATSTPVVLTPGEWRTGVDARMGPSEVPPPGPDDPPPDPVVPLENQSPPRITGTPMVGQTLLADPGSWSGGGPVTYTYAWTRSGRTVGTGRSYLATTEDAGHDLAVVVTATSNDRTASAWSGPVRVTRASSATRITQRPPTAAGADRRRVRIVVSVAGPGEALPGRVKLWVDGRPVSTHELNRGRSMWTLLLEPGAHRLRARFLGSPAWRPSRDRSTIRVR